MDDRTEPFIERELSFFVPYDKLVERVKLTRLSRTEIYQAYFPRERATEMAALTLSLKELDSSFSPVEFSSARLRHLRRGGSENYFLEVKSKKRVSAGLLIERLEVSVGLAKDVFVKFQPLADAGAIRKQRYNLPGQVLGVNGTCHEIVAHIDILIETGQGNFLDEGRFWRRNKFAIVDVELASAELVRQFRRGAHSFEFLREGAIELASTKEKLSNPLRMKRLARKGLDAKAREAVELLHKLCL